MCVLLPGKLLPGNSRDKTSNGLLSLTFFTKIERKKAPTSLIFYTKKDCSSSDSSVPVNAGRSGAVVTVQLDSGAADRWSRVH